VVQLDEGAFLDLLYSAPMDPARWTSVMDRFADMVGGSGAWLSRLNVADGSGTGMISRIDPAMPAIYMAHFAGMNPFSNEADPRNYIVNWTPRVRFYEEWLSRDAVERTEYYNDFLRPQDIYCSMMIGLAADGLETCVLNINRSHKRGDFEAAEVAVARRLHPHLLRAFNLSRRLEATNLLSNDLGVMLDGLNHGIFMVDSMGRIQFANTLAAAMVAKGSGLRVEQSRLVAAMPAATGQLQGLIGRATASDAGVRRDGSMKVVNSETGAWLAVAVNPLPERPTTVFNGGRMAMVSVTDPRAGNAASDSRLQQLFGLTPAEVRVALALLDGRSPAEAAAQLGISVQTVRNQLQGLYQKTMTSRQAELVVLLLKVCGPRSGP